jgi:hypothetical protein
MSAIGPDMVDAEMRGVARRMLEAAARG